MTFHKENEENMDKYYADVKSFFTGLLINGPLHERAKKVSEFIERGKAGDHYVIALRGKDVAWNISVLNGHSKFTNNGVDFYLGELANLKNVEELKKKVMFGIEAAELNGGCVNQKLNSFLHVFTEQVNLIIYTPANKDSDFDSYFWYRNDCHFTEKRGTTIYKVWLH